MNDQRVIMASGYPIDPTLTTEGRVLVSAQVQDGTIRTEKTITPGGTACTQDYAMLTDVATARKQMKDASGVATGQKQLVGAYFGDTWGNLWQYGSASDSITLVNAFGCQQPLHFSPTVVQMDADDPSNTFAGQIFLVQVTNSSLDHDTESYAASKMVIFKETFSTGAPAIDTTFGTGGQITLTSGVGGKLCGVSSADGTTYLTQLPSNARPLATPTGIIKPDGTGFVLLSNWYAPATNGCGKGSTYLQIHDFSGGTVSLKQALKIADEPVVNPIIVNGNLMISSSNGPISINGSVSIKVETATEPLRNTGDPFQMSGWTEIQ
jgi:hypothetical protein